MSRIAKAPINVPGGVEISQNGSNVKVKGPKGEMSTDLHTSVQMEQNGDVLNFSPVNGDKSALSMTGTMRSIVNNMVAGVTAGFQKKLELVGVGYRAQAKGKVLNLTLGFSHPVSYNVPEGITVETPSATEVIVSGVDKQLVGQAAANIRAYRPPEPYKGKGVKYSDEVIVRKEAKKK